MTTREAIRVAVWSLTDWRPPESLDPEDSDQDKTEQDVLRHLQDALAATLGRRPSGTCTIDLLPLRKGLGAAVRMAESGTVIHIAKRGRLVATMTAYTGGPR